MSTGSSRTIPPGEPLHRNGEDCVGVRAPLADINGKTLNALVKAAWVNNAPKQLVVRLAEANDTSHVGDLPANLGKPALRALRTVGITRLQQAATWSESVAGSLVPSQPRRRLQASTVRQGPVATSRA